MDDLISRQAAIEGIDAVFPVDPMRSEYAQGIACGAALAKTYVAQLPSAQQWIPCSERLPEDDETVLVTRDNGIIEKATFEVGEVNNGWWMDFWYSEDNVKAWMPLPEPYKGEE